MNQTVIDVGLVSELESMKMEDGFQQSSIEATLANAIYTAKQSGSEQNETYLQSCGTLRCA